MTVAADLTPKTAEKLSELSGMLVRPPVGTNKEGAIAYLHCSERKFDELRRKGIVRALDRGWYAYADLDAAVEWLRGYAVIRRSATFSPCRKHRFMLSRIWAPDLPTMMIVGLNPSTADETEDDPTIRRCIAYARREGCGSLFMLNMFSFRSTDPKPLSRMGLDELTYNNENIRHLKVNAKRVRDAGGLVVVAWGAHGNTIGRASPKGQPYSGFLRIHLGDGPLWCLGHTATGEPKHPLYLRSDQPLEYWTPWHTRLPKETTLDGAALGAGDGK